MFASTDYTFQKDHYSVFVPMGKLLQAYESHCHHHFEYAVIELSSFSRTPVRFSFPRRVQAYQFHCGRSFVSSNPPPSPEHRFSFLIPQNTAGWSTKLFPFLDMSTNFFISPRLFVTLPYLKSNLLFTRGWTCWPDHTWTLFMLKTFTKGYPTHKKQNALVLTL